MFMKIEKTEGRDQATLTISVGNSRKSLRPAGSLTLDVGLAILLCEAAKRMPATLCKVQVEEVL